MLLVGASPPSSGPLWQHCWVHINPLSFCELQEPICRSILIAFSNILAMRISELSARHIRHSLDCDLSLNVSRSPNPTLRQTYLVFWKELSMHKWHTSWIGNMLLNSRRAQVTSCPAHVLIFDSLEIDYAEES